jgi:arginyl-tRNA synthetase
MSQIIQILQRNIARAFQTLYDSNLEPESFKLERTRKEFEGDFTFVVFQYLKISKAKPEDTANQIGSILVEMGEVSSFNVVKGFLNISLKKSFWINFLQNLPQIDAYGKGTQKGKVMVEYSSPNTNKPLHLGHIRNNLLGFAVSNILEHSGYEVIKSNLVNDRGIHICKSMLAWSRFGRGDTPESTGIKGDHFVGKYYVAFDKAYKKELAHLQASGLDEETAKSTSELMLATREMLKSWELEDKEVRTLWHKMNAWVYQGFDATYKRLGVSFDKIYYESDTYLLGKKIVDEGLEQGVFFKKDDGSVWVDLTEEGLDEKLVLRADGTSVYITQDIGTADLKYSDFGMSKSIYVVGNEQDYHFEVLKHIIKRLKKPYADGIYHLNYGMVDLPQGKMKSREGTVVDADDLMEEMFLTAKARTLEQGKTDGMSEEEFDSLSETIGIGALKYFLLRVDANKRMLFNPEESIDMQGNTATFIQYTYARCASILRTSTEFNAHLDADIALNDYEKAILQHIFYFPMKAEEAAESLNPAIVANFAYELAKLYNSFYNSSPIFKEENPAIRNLRISLTKTTSELLKKSLNLLGISVPERM